MLASDAAQHGLDQLRAGRTVQALHAMDLGDGGQATGEGGHGEPSGISGQILGDHEIGCRDGPTPGAEVPQVGLIGPPSRLRHGGG